MDSSDEDGKQLKSSQNNSGERNKPKVSSPLLPSSSSLLLRRRRRRAVAVNVREAAEQGTLKRYPSSLSLKEAHQTPDSLQSLTLDLVEINRSSPFNQTPRRSVTGFHEDLKTCEPSTSKSQPSTPDFSKPTMLTNSNPASDKFRQWLSSNRSSYSAASTRPCSPSDDELPSRSHSLSDESKIPVSELRPSSLPNHSSIDDLIDGRTSRSSFINNRNALRKAAVEGSLSQMTKNSSNHNLSKDSLEVCQNYPCTSSSTSTGQKRMNCDNTGSSMVTPFEETPAKKSRNLSSKHFPLSQQFHHEVYMVNMAIASGENQSVPKDSKQSVQPRQPQGPENRLPNPRASLDAERPSPSSTIHETTETMTPTPNTSSQSNTYCQNLNQSTQPLAASVAQPIVSSAPRSRVQQLQRFSDVTCEAPLQHPTNLQNLGQVDGNSRYLTSPLAVKTVQKSSQLENILNHQALQEKQNEIEKTGLLQDENISDVSNKREKIDDTANNSFFSQLSTPSKPVTGEAMSMATGVQRVIQQNGHSNGARVSLRQHIMPVLVDSGIPIRLRNQPTQISSQNMNITIRASGTQIRQVFTGSSNPQTVSTSNKFPANSKSSINQQEAPLQAYISPAEAPANSPGQMQRSYPQNSQIQQKQVDNGQSTQPLTSEIPNATQGYSCNPSAQMQSSYSAALRGSSAQHPPMQQYGISNGQSGPFSKSQISTPDPSTNLPAPMPSYTETTTRVFCSESTNTTKCQCKWTIGTVFKLSKFYCIS